jgi:hypothetical protein
VNESVTRYGAYIKWKVQAVNNRHRIKIMTSSRKDYQIILIMKLLENWFCIF